MGSFVAWIDCGGMKELGECSLLVTRLEQFLSFCEVRRGGSLPDPVEGGAVTEIFWIPGIGLLEEVEGGIVILACLGALAALEQGIGRLAMEPGGAEAGEEKRDNERNSEEGFSKNGSGYERGMSAAVHRTPRRLDRSGRKHGRVGAALAALDAQR